MPSLFNKQSPFDRAIDLLMRPLWSHSEAIDAIELGEAQSHCWRYERIQERRDAIEAALKTLCTQPENPQGLNVSHAITGELFPDARPVTFNFQHEILGLDPAQPLNGWYWGNDSSTHFVWSDDDEPFSGSFCFQARNHHSELLWIVGNSDCLLAFNAQSGSIRLWKHFINNPEPYNGSLFEYIQQPLADSIPSCDENPEPLRGYWACGEGHVEEDHDKFYCIYAQLNPQWIVPSQSNVSSSQPSPKHYCVERNTNGLDWVARDLTEERIAGIAHIPSHDFCFEFSNTNLDELHEKYGRPCLRLGWIKRHTQELGMGIVYSSTQSEALLDQWLTIHNNALLRSHIQPNPEEHPLSPRVAPKRL